MRKLLFSRSSECIQPLRTLVEQQTHPTLVLWALDCAPAFLNLFEQLVQNDCRPRTALETAAQWARGQVKMPAAKQAIHAAHNAAASASNPIAEAAARAVGHAAATVHVETHALGLVFYGLTALVYNSTPEEADKIVDERLDWFYSRLLYWQNFDGTMQMQWAPFLLKNKPNKELLLRQKLESN